MRLAVLALVGLSACITPVDKPDDTDNPTGDLPASCTGGTTVADIQQGGFGDGDEVEIACAVVTAELTGTEDGFFIQDPGGGEWSGLYVYLYGGMEASDMDLEVGKLITIAGVISEWNDLTELSIATAYDVATIGEYPATIDEVDCGTSDWEPWEGCLISIDGLEVTSWPDSYGQVDTSCGMTFDDLYFDYNTGTGAVCSPVVGPLTYTYDEYRLVPRDEDDMAGCTEPEAVDGSSIVEMKASGAGDGDYVALEGVVITTETTPDGELFFVQDQGGGENSGLVVYVGESSYDAVVGAVVDIQGPLSIYYDLTEISPTQITDTGTTATPTPDVLAASPSDWEVYEGALITLQDVQITTDADNYGEVETNYGINIDDLFHDAGLDEGDDYTSVTGVVTYSYEAYKLLPRDADDLVL
jgi:predicted extracellular nuclease